MKETIISNIRGEDEYGQPIFIDRIYGTDNTRRLIQKDGTVYGGTLTKRRITVTVSYTHLTLPTIYSV